MIYDFEKITAKQVAGFLRQGQVGILPTDTVYGIGCLPKKEVLDRSYRIKNRNEKKPTAVLIGEFEQLKELAFTSNRVKRMMERFWPGDLTLVLPAKESLDPRVTAGGFIGVRFPNDRFLQEILKETGPLAVSSANLSQKPVPHIFREIDTNLIGLVDFVIRLDQESPKAPSTVARIETGRIVILRPGRIRKDDLAQV